MEQDWKLIEALLRGDTEAADCFVDRFSLFVYAILQREQGLPQEQAEDLFQDVFLRLWEDDWRRLRAWSGEGDFVSYLAPIVRNLARDRGRSDRRRAQLVVAGAGYEDAAAPRSSEPSPEELAWLEEQRVRLAEALHQLGPQDLELYERRFVIGQTYLEISAAMGASTSNVGVRLNRLTRRLKRVMDSPVRCSPLPFYASRADSAISAAQRGREIRTRREPRSLSAVRATWRATT